MNTPKTPRRAAKSLVAILVAACATVAASAQTSIVSINFKSGASAGNSWVTSDFGIADEGTVVGNWNNSSSFGAVTPTNNLIASDGTVTGISATTLNPGGLQFWGAGYILTPWNYGPAQFPATATSVSVTFNNLNAYFTNGYYAIVYVNGATANTGGAVTDGSTTYYFRPASPASVTPIQITTTANPGAGNFSVGNYAVFGSESVAYTSDSITFTIPTGIVADGNIGIGGIQLIGVIPEPASATALLGLVAIGFVATRRRRST